MDKDLKKPAFLINEENPYAVYIVAVNNDTIALNLIQTRGIMRNCEQKTRRNLLHLCYYKIGYVSSMGYWESRDETTLLVVGER